MVEKLNLLIIEDNDSDLKLLIHELKKGNIIFTYEHVDNKENYLQKLRESNFDIILSDYSLPQFNGMEALHLLKNQELDIPFILVTGSMNEEVAVECMKAGADDYILKDNLKRIPHALINSIKRKKERDEKRYALEKLKESEERYRALVEISPDAIIVHNDGIIIFANKAAAEAGGFNSPEELIGKNAMDFVHPAYKKISAERIGKMLKGESRVPVAEEVMVKTDGTLINVEVSAVKFPEKNSNAILTILRDISERKAFEKKLIEAKEKAESSNRFKATLLANLSHEFRTPMNGILGFSQLLKDYIVDPEQCLMVDSIIASGKRLMQTLSSILDLSLIEAGTLEIKQEKMDLVQLTKEVFDKYAEVFKEKGIEFDLNAEVAEAAAFIDPKSFKQVLINLVDNAYKFTHSGKVYLSIKIHKNTVAVSVKDTGIGITEEHKNLIFEPFRQVSEGTNRMYEGSGLGLTIAKKLVSLMNGKIMFTSKINQGSNFTIIFNLADGQVVQSSKKEVKVFTKKLDKPIILNKIKVLLIEDNFINKEVTVHYLKEFCDVDHAPNGEKAIAMAKEKNYQVLLVDINLGIGIDGIETLKEIRKMPQHELTVAVAITGYALRHDEDRILKEGFNYYLPKPFEKYEILDIMEKIISEI